MTTYELGFGTKRPQDDAMLGVFSPVVVHTRSVPDPPIKFSQLAGLSSYHQAATCTRVLTPSLSMMCRRWVSTVRAEMTSSADPAGTSNQAA